MKYKERDPFKTFVINILIIMLVTDIAILVWTVRKGQRESIERAARIEQFQQHYIACDAGPDVPGWIGG